MAAGDLFWDSVYVAMHMDAVGLPDVKGNPLTLSGGVARSATQSKFGGYSAYFDGVDDEIRNTDEIWDMQVNGQNGQFFCYPTAQTSTNPCVFQFRHWRLEYKPDGYPNGFVMHSEGDVRTPCGVHPEGQWYYIWYTVTSYTLRLYIDGQFIAEFPTGYWYDGWYFTLGSASLATYPDTAFAGYVEDFRMNKESPDPILGQYLRTDFSVPVSAFLDRNPDPEGPVAGSLTFSGAVTGIVAPTGSATASLAFNPIAAGYLAPVGVATGLVRFAGECLAEVPLGGPAAGRIKFTGLGAGVIGITGEGAGSLRFAGSALGAMGSFGLASGRLKFTGYGSGALGVSGGVNGSIRMAGEAVGSTPLLPVGTVAGSLRFSGNAYGSGGSIDSHCH